MKYKEQILALRKEGKTYLEIKNKLGCARSTIAYCLSEKVRAKGVARSKRGKYDRKQHLDNLKLQKGGKCLVCGYDRCLRALDFHHIDPSTKTITISSSLSTVKEREQEVEKCVLICSNCHRELHAGLIELVATDGIEPSYRVFQTQTMTT